MSEPFLLPCPFCGEDEKNPPYLGDRNVKNCGVFYFVQCTNCGCETGSFENNEGGIKAWNTRPALSTTNEFLLGFEKGKRQIIKMIETLSLEE